MSGYNLFNCNFQYSDPCSDALIIVFFFKVYSFISKANAFSNVKPGPSCSKLTTSLVNVSLKFQTLISQICQYFLLKKCEKLLHCIFSTKNISVFGYKVIKHLTSWPHNELVKLWTTGPRCQPWNVRLCNHDRYPQDILSQIFDII